MKKILSSQSFNTDFATLLLRLIFGGLFMYHGYSKLTSYDQMLTMFPDLIGIGSKLSLILVICAELGGGFLIFIGLFTRIAVIPILFTMIMAFFLAHAAVPFQQKELPFAYLLLALVIFTSGSGKYSVDGMMEKK